MRITKTLPIGFPSLLELLGVNIQTLPRLDQDSISLANYIDNNYVEYQDKGSYVCIDNGRKLTIALVDTNTTNVSGEVTEVLAILDFIEHQSTTTTSDLINQVIATTPQEF